MSRRQKRPSAWIVLNRATLVSAGFCILIAAGIAFAAVTSARRGDSEFNSATGAILVAVMCAFFLTIAVVILSPRLEKRAWGLWNLSVVALLIIFGTALIFQTDDFVSSRSTGIRSPRNLTAGRITGALLLCMGLVRAGVLARRPTR